MPFIPNEADAAFETQAAPDSQDFEALRAGSDATGVVSGCAVTAQGTPDMTAAVAAGVVAVDGAKANVAAGNVTLTADGTNPRNSIIVVSSAGVKSAVNGTPTASPDDPPFPAIPAGSVLLAGVHVPAADTDIDANQITDKRVFVIPPEPTTNYDLAKARDIPLVKERSQTVTLGAGQTPVHDMILVNGKLFAGTRVNPWHIIRFNNLEDLTDRTVVQSNGGAPGNDFDDAESVCWVPEVNRLYVAGNRSSKVVIHEVDPDTLAISTPINETLTFGQGLSPALASDGTYLYIVTYNTNSKVYKYRLSDYVLEDEVTLTGLANGHAMIYDGDSLYAGGNSSPAWVAKINPADLTFTSMTFDSGVNAITHPGLASAGDAVFVAIEGSPGSLWKVDKGTLAETQIAGVTSQVAAVHFDGEYVWAAQYGAPGKLSRVDPATGETATHTFASGEDHAYVMASEGKRLFLTFFDPVPNTVKRLDPSGLFTVPVHAQAHSISGTDHTGTLTDGQIPGTIARDSELHVEDHDHDGTPTQTLLASRTHGSPSADTHHPENHGADKHTGIGAALSVTATSDTSESLGIGFVDATGLSFAVAANKTYHFEWYILFTSAATTTGLYVAVNGPASPTAIAYEAKYPFGQTTTSARNAVAYDAGTSATGSYLAATPLFAKMQGILVNGSNAGTLQVRFQTEVPTSAVVIKAGSGGRLWLMN